MRLRAGVLAAVAGLVLALVGDPGTACGAEKLAIKSVVEWEQVPAADIQTPSLTTAQLLAEYDKVAAAGAALTSWEARCRVTWSNDLSQMSGGMSASAKASAPATYSTFLVSCGKQWVSERRSGVWQDEKIEYRRLCDDEHVRTVSPSDKTVTLQTRAGFTAREAAAISRPELPVAFPPFLATQQENCSPPESFPDVRKILADPNTKVLPWRTRANGHVCYVVERTTITESPIFRSSKDAHSWTSQNSGRPVILTINPNAKPEDKRSDKQIVRMALDPEAGFMPVRWATGQGFVLPEIDYLQFPHEEITCTDFRKFGSQGYVAGRLVYTQYSADRQGKQKTKTRQEVVLEDFAVDQEYPARFFDFNPPKGYQVLDSIRGIEYAVDDPPEKIAALLAAAQAKKAFYEALKRKPAPPLKAAQWLNSRPIRLEDARGKRVRLYFWSMACGPCVYRLPLIQQEWERESRHRANLPLFISVHPYVEGEELEQLKNLLRKKQITFPVMVDSRDPNGKTWGKTFAYYVIHSVPSDVWFDAQGHFDRHEPDSWMGENDWWMSSVGKSEPKSTSGGETEPPVKKAKE